jgi:hypothetical protein
MTTAFVPPMLIAVGGDAAALERVRPYLLTMGPGGITHVGPLGLAKTMKIATNLGVAVQMLAFCEAVILAEKSGIARELAVEALLKSVIASPMVKYRGPVVVGRMPTDAWFPVPMIQKDLQLALDQAPRRRRAAADDRPDPGMRRWPAASASATTTSPSSSTSSPVSVAPRPASHLLLARRPEAVFA